MASQQELMARIAELEAQVNAKNGGGEISFRDNNSGTVSVFGNGRFPTSLYPKQWLRILDVADKLRAHIMAGVQAGRVSLDKAVPPKNPVPVREKAAKAA